ncbi:MAG: hypothetical protein WCG04_00570 [Alphaproteobacteria bacterium]
MESELILSIGGLPPLSARGCTQELMPIQQNLFRRTINGSLLYLGQKTQQRYRSIITCQDQSVLATEGLWPGQHLRMGCIQRLWQKADGNADGAEVLLEREAIEGSVIAVDDKQNNLRILEQAGRKVRLAASETPVFLSYRPWLDVQVINFKLLTHEWDIKAAWRLEVEEN